MRTIAALLLLACSAAPLLAQGGPRTFGATTLGDGLLEAGLGAEYAVKAAAPFPGAPTSLWRVPSVALRWGAADKVDLQFDWSGRLLAGYAGGGHASDWGDPVITTVVTALAEGETRPALGLRVAVKLPSTSYLPAYLGSDQTDVAFALLASRHAGAAELRLNIGLMIVGNPRELGSQDDIYNAGAALLVPFSETCGAFAEALGSTGYKDRDDKLLVRAGLAATSGCWRFEAHGGLRVAGDGWDFGPAFSGTEDWSAGFTCTKRIALD